MSSTQDATPTPFELIGGEDRVRALVDRFYDLMDREPSYAAIRALHPADLADSRDKLFWFLCGWLGGTQHYVERFGHPQLRARHLPFPIGIRERDQWVECMGRAMDGAGVAPDLKARLSASLMQTADWMRNRAENAAGPAA